MNQANKRIKKTLTVQILDIIDKERSRYKVAVAITEFIDKNYDSK